MYILVMESRLVDYSVQILSLLLKAETNVNSIINETGLYRDYVHIALPELKKAGLISRTRTKKHSQMILNKLTPLGVSIAEFNRAVEDFNISYAKLIRLFTENLDFDLQDF